MSNADVVSLTIFPLIVLGLLLLLVLFAIKYQQLAREEEDVALQESKEERIRKLKEAISNGLNVREWVPDDPQVESTEENQDTPSSGEMVEAPQPPPAPKNSPSASCAMGSEDCEQEMAGCAICLCHFKPKQLVCESNNSSCRHVFHKDCMVDWLMKQTENSTCPMCREVYLIKAV
jgi:hypothetical protein